MKTILLATHVVSMSGAVIRDGGVASDGELVVDVGVGREIRLRHPDAEVIELGDTVLLPGLVNAHVHLELTNVPRPEPAPGAFVDWILAVREWMSKVADLPAFVRASTLAGIDQCLRFGVTAVGDVTLNPRITRPLLAGAGLRGVSFGEVLGMAGRMAQFDRRLDEAVERQFETQWLRAGIEPHAPYSLDLAGYRRCVSEATARSMPLATHVAETADEGPFLARHEGEFRRLWEALGAWREGVSRDEGGPIHAMKRIGLLDHRPVVLAHANDVDDRELSILSESRASVVYCPRTHAYFHRPPHRFREMLARGINVAIGTDSCASSPDLNLLDDLRWVRRLHPDLDAASLFEMVTTRAARALGMEGRIGCIAPGASADFIAFRRRGGDPLGDILESDDAPARVWLRGNLL